MCECCDYDVGSPGNRRRGSSLPRSRRVSPTAFIEQRLMPNAVHFDLIESASVSRYGNDFLTIGRHACDLGARHRTVKPQHAHSPLTYKDMLAYFVRFVSSLPSSVLYTYSHENIYSPSGTGVGPTHNSNGEATIRIWFGGCASL